MKIKSHYQICSRCIMDTSDPDIVFDDNGVCNHCKRAEQLLAEKWFPNEVGERKLQEISHTIKQYGTGKEYDCIIGVSGGVDSSYLLHVAKKMIPFVCPCRRIPLLKTYLCAHARNHTHPRFRFPVHPAYCPKG